MKKLIPLMTFAIIILFGCAKEEVTSTSLITDKQQVNETSSSAYVFNFDSDSPTWEVISLDELPSSLTTSVTTRSNSAHTHGDFTGYGGTTTITFSGTQNNGGSHGFAEVIQSFGPFLSHVVLETECVVVINENEAIYGGVITEVLENNFPSPPPPPPGAPAPPCNPNDLGSSVYFKVIDNGQGSNAPADQHYGIVLQFCSPSVDCSSSFPWFIFGVNDVENEGDKIKVND